MPRATKKQVAARMELYRAGLTDSQIADRTGVSAHTIQSWRARHSLRDNSKREKLKASKTSGELLAERNAEARAHGMSYGKYWAMKREESKTTTSYLSESSPQAPPAALEKS